MAGGFNIKLPLPGQRRRERRKTFNELQFELLDRGLSQEEVNRVRDQFIETGDLRLPQSRPSFELLPGEDRIPEGEKRFQQIDLRKDKGRQLFTVDQAGKFSAGPKVQPGLTPSVTKVDTRPRKGGAGGADDTRQTAKDVEKLAFQAAQRFTASSDPDFDPAFENVDNVFPEEELVNRFKPAFRALLRGEQEKGDLLLTNTINSLRKELEDNKTPVPKKKSVKEKVGEFVGKAKKALGVPNVRVTTSARKGKTGTDGLIKVKTSDGRTFPIFKKNLEEAKKRDPGLKVVN